MKHLLTLSVCALFVRLLSASAQGPPLPATMPVKAAIAESINKSPEWLNSAVIYEINPRAFSPAGDLRGITAKLDQLESLGINVLWIMPIYPMGQIQKKGSEGSPYAVRDYYEIDHSYGSKEDLHQLIAEAHRRKMKVILDVVLNHTSLDSVLSKHSDFYKHDANGKILSPYDWTDVAALNYENPKLRQYMIEMLTYWVKVFDFDGFRCDAAGEVPTSFWEEARLELNRVHPGVLMLAEASRPELLSNAFDLDYSWPLLAAMNNVLEHGSPASSIELALIDEKKIFPSNSMHMRMFDDHDEQRALARYGAPGSIAVAALIFTLDGVPMIYNGMEVSDTTESGAPALFEPLKIWWDAGKLRPEFLRFYKFMISFRAQQTALRSGDTIWIHNSDEAHVLTYLRRSPDEELLITINLSATPFRGTVECPGSWAEVKVPDYNPYRNTNGQNGPQADDHEAALPALSLNSFQFRIFHRPTPPVIVQPPSS